MTAWESLQESVYRTITDRQLSYEQRILALAKLAENVRPYPEIPEAARACFCLAFWKATGRPRRRCGRAFCRCARAFCSI